MLATKQGHRFNASIMHSKIAKYLIENGADANIVNDSGNTPLMKASKNGFNEVVQYLVKNGADINTKYYERNTALDIAKNEEHTEIIEYLKSKGAK